MRHDDVGGQAAAQTAAADVDAYAVLGVAADASDAELRAQWRRLAKRYHPDRQGGDPSARADAARRMAELNAAWALVSTPSRRADYDRRRHGAHVVPADTRVPVDRAAASAIADAVAVGLVDRMYRGAGDDPPPSVERTARQLTDEASARTARAAADLAVAGDVPSDGPEAAAVAHLAVGYALIAASDAVPDPVEPPAALQVALTVADGAYDELESHAARDPQISEALPGRVTVASLTERRRAAAAATDPTGQPAGWRLDPYTQGRYWRWWDGHEWADAAWPDDGPTLVDVGARAPDPPRRRRLLRRR